MPRLPIAAPAELPMRNVSSAKPPASPRANPAVQFNLGLLLAEAGRKPEDELALHAALQADSKLAPAAYNLAILVSARDINEAIILCRQAIAASPDPRHHKFLASLLSRAGR